MVVEKQKSALDSLSDEELAELYQFAISNQVSGEFVIIIKNTLLKREAQLVGAFS
ncbi:hypothetical protein ACFSTH_03425 [Paenibacillus yanchengensis]|uniref:Sporulation histidine kinase inhibitor Sda n=1 Tax=Paenibacillus yanchengensis TaxID=2035833 RepID=A0ABW4YG12_9BACL